MNSIDVLQQLPVETLTSVLRYLSDDELRRAAAASRHLRAVALDNAGLCLRFSYQMRVLDPGQQRQNMLRAVIDYARSERLPLDLSIDCFFIPTAEQIAFVAACLPHALPQLVKLSVVFFRGFTPEIYTPLCQPAPQLRELRLRGAPDKIPDGVIPSAALLPVDLLAGSAPQLVTLELHDLFLSARAPMEAFKRVRSLTVTYASAIPHMDMSKHFPALRTLEIRCESCAVIPGDSPALDFCHIALERLTLEADPSLMREFDDQLAASPHFIPLVRRYCDAGNWGDSAWDRFSETLNLRMRRTGGWAEANVVSAVSRICRTHWFYYYEFVPHTAPSHCPPLSELRILANRLVYIRLDRDFIPELLDIGCAMPVLRRLMLDLDGEKNALWPPYYHADNRDLEGKDFASGSFDPGSDALYDLPCPALEALAIVAAGEDNAGINAREVAHLGQALGQAARGADKRARLELHGTGWDGPVPQDLLARVFSAAVWIPFTIDDPDNSLWAPCFQ